MNKIIYLKSKTKHAFMCKMLALYTSSFQLPFIISSTLNDQICSFSN